MRSSMREAPHQASHGRFSRWIAKTQDMGPAKVPFFIRLSLYPECRFRGEGTGDELPAEGKPALVDAMRQARPRLAGDGNAHLLEGRRGPGELAEGDDRVRIAVDQEDGW